MVFAGALENGEPVCADSPIPAGNTKPSIPVTADPRQWSVDEVCAWVTFVGLEQYSDAFQKHHIDGQELLHLSHETLWTGIGIGGN